MKNNVSIILLTALGILLFSIIGCDETGQITAPVLDEIVKPDAITPALAAEEKQPAKEAPAEAEESAETPEQQEQTPAQDTIPPTVTAHLALYKTNSGDIVELLLIADEEIAIATSRVRFTIAGKRYGEPVTLTFVKEENSTYTYAASFTVTNTTPAGVVGITITPKDTAGNAAPKVTTTQGGTVTIEPPPLSISAILTKSGELGSDVRQSETITVKLTANRDLTGQTVQFFVDGRPEGRSKRLTHEQGNTYHASFVADRRTPAGPITVRFADGRDIEVHERLWSVKTHPPPPAHVGAPAVYTQWVDAGGFPIVAADAVNPRALDEAAWTMKQMLAHKPGWLQKLGDAGSYFVILEYSISIFTFFDRENANRGDTESWLRGVALHKSNIAANGEENVLNYQYATDLNVYNASRSGVIHEITHLLHLALLKDTDFNIRLIRAYNTAKEQGLWGKSYVVKNHYEYLATGTEVWFGENIPWLRNYVGASRESLRQYDRNLADLVEEMFGDRPWRWTPARDRLHLPHLQGYDAENTPHFNPNTLQ